MKLQETLQLIIGGILLIIIIVLSVKIKVQDNKISSMQVEMKEQATRYIFMLDSATYALTEQMINSLVLRDSMENEKFGRLQQQQLKLNKQYEKINANYGAIIINRPDF